MRTQVALVQPGGDGVDLEVRRLVDLGASERARQGALVVMHDPEGNEFCGE